MRVEDGSARLGALPVGEQLLKALARLVELGVGFGEDARDRAPARPPRQRLALELRGGRAAFAQLREDLEGLKVGGRAGGGPSGRDRVDVGLPPRAGQLRLRLSVSSCA